MITILLHTSKTMRQESLDSSLSYKTPVLEDKANFLAQKLKDLSVSAIETGMKVSQKKAQETHVLIQNFTPGLKMNAAIDSFLGDIFSGLQVQSFSEADRQYAQDHLRILSGLYGVLRPLDGIQPYRLEMGYTLTGIGNLYTFWGNSIAKVLEPTKVLIDLTAKEYSKAALPYLDPKTSIISPKFLTVSPKTHEPLFVTIHAKIARGAYAKWLIQSRIQDPTRLKEFHALGYRHSEELSSPNQPVYIAETFQGLGLSVRLT